MSYSTKYWGIIGERYGLKDYILDIRYLSYDEMKKRFIDLMNTIELEYDEIQNKMEHNNKLANKNIIKTLKEITKL